MIESRREFLKVGLAGFGLLGLFGFDEDFVEPLLQVGGIDGAVELHDLHRVGGAGGVVEAIDQFGDVFQQAFRGGDDDRVADVIDTDGDQAFELHGGFGRVLFVVSAAVDDEIKICFAFGSALAFRSKSIA